MACAASCHSRSERPTEAVFPVYQLHQTVTVLAVAALALWHWHPAAEALRWWR